MYFLGLPSLATDSILKDLSLADLIDFSLCSQKCKRMVRQLHLPYTGMEIWNSKGNRHIYIRQNDRVLFSWEFYPKRKKIVGKRKINGTTIISTKFSKHANTPYIYSKSSQPDVTMQIVLAHFCEIFRFPIKKVTLFYDDITIFRSAVASIRHCETVDLRGNQLISGEDFRFFLENVGVRKKLELRIRALERFDCDWRADCDVISVNDAHWMTLQNLMNMSCRTARLCNCAFRDEDLISFVRNWLISGDKRLELLELSNDCQLVGSWFDEEKFSTLLNGVPWDARKRAENYRVSSEKLIYCSKGIDIEREDGLMATIIVGCSVFKFVVWHDRFPV